MDEKLSDEIASKKKDGRFSVCDPVEGCDWKKHFTINPNVNEYGNHKADIIDFCIEDENGKLNNSIIKGSRFKIKTKVRFNEEIKNPICTLTLKTIRGIDVTGTNTMIEQRFIEDGKPGDVYVVTYEQQMNLQGGEYLISMSCTGFVDGNLTAYHRCYDLISINVISDKDTVGFLDMNSDVTVEKI